MSLILTHPVVSAIIAYFLLSALADGLNQVPPRPTDSRLYLFVYAVFQGLVGNVITALATFISKKKPNV